MKKLLSLKQVDWKLSTSIAMVIFDFNKKEFFNDWFVSFVTYLLHLVHLSDKNTVSVGKDVTSELSPTQKKYHINWFHDFYFIPKWF